MALARLSGRDSFSEALVRDETPLDPGIFRAELVKLGAIIYRHNTRDISSEVGRFDHLPNCFARFLDTVRGFFELLDSFF